MTTVTVDTNGLDSANVLRLQSAAEGHDVVFAAITVSERELQGSDIRVPVSQLAETAVWDESQWDKAVWAGRIDLFVIGTDNAVWTKRSVNGVWNSYTQLGNNQVKDVAATSPAAGRMSLFVIGTDNAVWTKRSVNDAWSGYTQLGNGQVKGIATTSPTFPAVSSGLIDLFVIGTDNAVWTKRSENYGASFSGYSQLGPSQVKGIAAAATAKAAQLYELNLLVIGTDNAVWKNSLVGCSTGCL